MRDMIISEMQRRGWTVRDLLEAGADRITTHRTSLARYLRGEQDLTGEKLAQVLRVLELNVCGPEAGEAGMGTTPSPAPPSSAEQP